MFITAYDEYTTRALRYSGIHCLYKPIDISEFENTLAHLNRNNEQTGDAIEIARQLLQSKFTRIPVITEKGLQYVTPEQINYMETHDGGSRIFFNDFKNLLTNKPLADLAAVMENNSFAMVRNNLLVNLKNIVVEKTKPGKVIFSSGAELRMEPEEVNKLLRMLG